MICSQVSGTRKVAEARSSRNEKFLKNQIDGRFPAIDGESCPRHSGRTHEPFTAHPEIHDSAAKGVDLLEAPHQLRQRIQADSTH